MSKLLKCPVIGSPTLRHFKGKTAAHGLREGSLAIPSYTKKGLLEVEMLPNHTKPIQSKPAPNAPVQCRYECDWLKTKTHILGQCKDTLTLAMTRHDRGRDNVSKELKRKP